MHRISVTLIVFMIYQILYGLINYNKLVIISNSIIYSYDTKLHRNNYRKCINFRGDRFTKF